MSNKTQAIALCELNSLNIAELINIEINIDYLLTRQPHGGRNTLSVCHLITVDAGGKQHYRLSIDPDMQQNMCAADQLHTYEINENTAKLRFVKIQANRNYACLLEFKNSTSSTVKQHNIAVFQYLHITKQHGVA